MFKLLSSVEKRTEERDKEIEEKKVRKPMAEAVGKKLDVQILAAFRKTEDEEACGNFHEAAIARAKWQQLRAEKFSLFDSLHRELTSLEIAQREDTAPYIQQCIFDITRVVKQVLGERKFEITGKARDANKDTPIFDISHNWGKIGEIVNGLMEKMDEIRRSDLLPISKIKVIYESALKAVPDAFPLENKAEGGPTMLERFREGGPSAITVESDSFVHMNMMQAKALGDVGRLKQALQGLKSFFKNARA